MVRRDPRMVRMLAMVGEFRVVGESLVCAEGGSACAGQEELH
ncbi:hypothetical protein [Bartonella bovis]|nr:hypothetical protein [Bartonella bovis]